MIRKTRRSFLQFAAVGAVGAAFADYPFLRGETSQAARPVRAWITSSDQRFSAADAPQWLESQNVPDIRINPSVRRQSILGFGAAFTDASCYLIDRLPEPARTQLLNEFFGPDGLRFSIGRTCIGSSDYSLSAFNYDPTPDLGLKNFSVAHDEAYILPMLKAAQAASPGLFLFSSPWSPPGWMKTGDSMLGGSMRKGYFAEYAKYFVRFLEAYRDEGVHIDAVTVQNEVDTDQNGRMPACLWGQEYEVEFVKSYLGPALQRASLDTRIWILDHNYDLWGRVMDELSDPVLNKYVDGVAWHGYAGEPDAMSRVHEAFPAKHAYWTEGGPDYTKPDYTTDWTRWSTTFTDVLRNWARCAVGWNLVLDEQGKPNIGPFSCGGLVTIHSETQKITRSGQYWAFAHFSKAIERGAHVLESSGQVDDVSHVALENPDGTRVLILTNRGEARTVNCQIDAHNLAVQAPKDGIATLIW
jgi:glucosylceramidase